MAKNPVIEVLQGPINGTNTIFETSVQYRPGTIHIFINGMLGARTLVDGWTELGGKKIKLKEVPRSTDILQAIFIPR